LLLRDFLALVDVWPVISINSVRAGLIFDRSLDKNLTNVQ
jgi:hypothetical protein